MTINMLSELNPHGLNCNICVCVSRMWEFCDKDSGQIKHLDLVIVYEKNDAMYVEIPPEEISTLKNHLSEGKIVDIRRFLVHKAKSVYKVVEAPYMIKLSQRSIITPVIPEPRQFPKYVFNLIPFSEIKQHAGLTNRFLVTYANRTTTKNIHNRGEQVEISLLGPRAIEFDGDKVYNEGQKTPIITIFALILSTSSACRWYTNEDIPAIHEFYGRLLDIQGDELEAKTLLQLKKEVDPVDHRLYECTVTITRLSPNQSWCYLACKLCHSKSYLQGSDYKCSSEECTCTQIEYIRTYWKTCRQKYTFVVKISAKKSFARPNNPSFDVQYITHQFGKQAFVPIFQKQEHITTSTSSFVTQKHLPALVPIKYKPDTEQFIDICRATSPSYRSLKLTTRQWT
uniref:Replication protein A 70 kDa DNA-binding subunit B/D first OB fold domain-containing protein n=1 Tax=Setaria italica TaxID=4555 RepID=K3YMT2_SETIT